MLKVYEMLYDEDSFLVFSKKYNYIYVMASQYEDEFNKIE